MRPGPWVCAFLLLYGCSQQDQGATNNTTLFTDVTNESGVTFTNALTFTESFNTYTYRNFYNGGGVAVGDINNDGLQDVYFGGNQTDNKLYLNTGDFKFKDITDQAGVACSGVWTSGVTFVDINADGFLDIYVCKSGDPNTPKRYNELFINNGDLTFREESAKYGLDITGLSVQAAFFDFDKDNDLDCYLLTNSIRSVGNYDLVKDQRQRPDPQGGGNKFFVNENGKFVDRSAQAGIYRSNIGFGLGVTLGDFNGDSWVDIFVSNDFFERDYLYINNTKGGFDESLTDYFESISFGSMGADLADLDGDGVKELFVTEMLPDSLNRKKTKTVYDGWDKYQLNVQNGYYHQFPRNTLQTKTGEGNYVEVGRMAGVAASEWSWGPLLFDMDNDGLRDIFIANGIQKDLLDRDYLAYTAAEENIKKVVQERNDAIISLIDLMPQSPIPNYAFRNDGGLHFTNMATEWGMGQPDFSNGAAYGDLDNDGDLDLVINKVNSPSTIYRNNSDTSERKGVNIALTSATSNTHAVGANVTAYVGSKVFFADNFVARGFESAVQPWAHLGLGNEDTIDSLLVDWPAGGSSMLYNVPVKNGVIKVDDQSRVNKKIVNSSTSDLTLTQVGNSLFKHKASGLIDFNRDRLLPMMYSNETPSILKGDIDKDGKQELYIGGGKDQEGVMIRYRDSKFRASPIGAMNPYVLSEETKGTLFDVDGDGDLDLYMSTGGRFFPGTSSVLTDHIFVNDGKGNFKESPERLPSITFVSTSIALPVDYDGDGDSDLFIGERFDPFIYGLGGSGYMLANDGTGKFTDVTQTAAPMLKSIGMITDASIVDIDGNGWMDIVVVGDWMPINVLLNDKGVFTDASKQMNLAGTEGWWHDIEAADLNQDGKMDFILGNQGLNSFFKPGDRMYVGDFDRSGSVEQIFCTKVGDQYSPLVDRDEFVSQMPSMKKKLLYYKDYGRMSMNDLFKPEVLQEAGVFQVNLLSSIMLLSGPAGYQKVELPAELQYSPLYALLLTDLDKDGVVDLIAGGNNYQVKPQFGRNDASNCWLFKGRIENGNYTLAAGKDLNVKGEVRDIEHVEYEGITYLVFAKHNEELEIYKVR